MKSEGVKDITNWLEDKLKDAKQGVIYAEAELVDYKKNRPMMVEYNEFYEQCVEKAQLRLSVLLEVKQGCEKYMKKLKYQGE